MKKKKADRSNWKRVISREYTQTYLMTEDFNGYVTLLRIEKVTEPLYVQNGSKKMCIADDGFTWLQHFPIDALHTVTTMFDSSEKIVQWYIDICLESGIDEEGIPYYLDLYLDLVVLPDGGVFLMDVEELEDALSTGLIDEVSYSLAWNEAQRLMDELRDGHFALLHQSEAHRSLLVKHFPS